LDEAAGLAHSEVGSGAWGVMFVGGWDVCARQEGAL
jgi:hypothetical protein